MVDRKDTVRFPTVPLNSLDQLSRALVEVMADELIKFVEKRVPALADRFADRPLEKKRQDVIELVESGMVRFTWDSADEVFGFLVYSGSKYVSI